MIPLKLHPSLLVCLKPCTALGIRQPTSDIALPWKGSPQRTRMCVVSLLMTKQMCDAQRCHSDTQNKH